MPSTFAVAEAWLVPVALAIALTEITPPLLISALADRFHSTDWTIPAPMPLSVVAMPAWAMAAPSVADALAMASNGYIAAGINVDDCSARASRTDELTDAIIRDDRIRRCGSSAHGRRNSVDQERPIAVVERNGVG